MQQDNDTIRVWDPVVRLGHWTLVASFFTAYFTEDDFLGVHVWAGYVLAAVLLFRLLWGFVGSKHARFSDFIYTPARIGAYLRSLRQGRAEHYLGHNPAGGLMIILLLICLALTTWTGLELYAVEHHAGPLAERGQAPAVQLIAAAQADQERRRHDDDDDDDDDDHGGRDAEEGEEFWEELHDFLANFTLMLVIVHISGAVVSSYLHRENLVKAMITGNKRRQP
jgi:cytochrome b